MSDDKRTGKVPAGLSHARERMDSEELLRALRVAVPVEDSHKVEQRREALVRAIRQEITATPQRLERRERRLTWRRWTMAAAALLVVGLGTAAATQYFSASADSVALESSDDVSSGTAQLVLQSHQGNKQSLLHAGDNLGVVHGDQAHLSLPGGTQAELLAPADRGQLRLARSETLEQEFYLERGRLAVDVPERRDMRRRVVVHTPEARVQVKGTQFVVHVLSEGEQEVTVVSVQRGSVWVTHRQGQTVLHAGDTWRSTSVQKPSGTDHAAAASVHRDDSAGSATTQTRASEASATTQPHSSAVSQRSVASQRPVVSQRAAVAPQERGEERSTLGEQNRLLEQAVAAQKSGDSQRASELLSELLRRYPESPLRATVLAEQRRLRQQP